MKLLDVANTKIETAYCVSEHIREDQVAIALTRIAGRVVPQQTLSDEEIAIVCYGPSLKHTWPLLSRFKKIMTCSGAHKFLLERGIVPTWHLDLDPREHKVDMLGTPHKSVQYLIASCCHPKMWDVLDGFDVKIWHILNNQDNKEIPLSMPRGDWIWTGGNNVGVRCLTMARVLGYRKFHVFGMDYSFPKDQGHHADKHLNASKKVYPTPYEGKMYYCEPVMIEYARNFFHEMNQLPDVKVILYGEGLLQHMANAKRNEKVEIKKTAVLGFATPVTATPEHIELHRKLHLNPVYGMEGRTRKTVVLNLAAALKTQSILDYGCGKGSLGAKLPFPIWEYDPAVPGKDAVPRPADLVLCFNVLEVVEREMLDNVLGDLVRCAKVCVFAIIDMNGPIKGDKAFWSAKLNEFFKVAAVFEHETELHCVLEPRKLGAKGK